MDLYFIAAHLTGFIAFGITVYSMQKRDNRNIIMGELSASICWIVHLCLIDAHVGSVISLLAIFRCTVVLYMLHNYKTHLSLALVAAAWIFCIYAYHDFYSLFPPLAFTIMTFGTLSKERRVLSNCLLLRDFLWLSYAALSGSYYMFATSSICFTSCLIGKFRHERRRSTDVDPEAVLIKQPV